MFWFSVYIKLKVRDKQRSCYSAGKKETNEIKQKCIKNRIEKTKKLKRVLIKTS